MTRGAVLDLGSSSFQLLVCDMGRSRGLRPILKRQTLLNLGLEVGSAGAISPGRSAASVAAARCLRRALDRANADFVLPLATAALRDASNGAEVVAHLEHAIGARIRVLDGDEEARLCFVGQRGGVYVGESATLGIDLGGGSFQLAVGNCFDIYQAASAPVGPTRLKGELQAGDLLDSGVRKEVRERVREAIEAMNCRLDRYPHVASRTVVSGGTARALARLAIAKTRGYAGAPGWGVNQVELAAGQVADLAERLAQLDLRRRRQLPGMPARRAVVLPLGACVLQAIAEELAIEHFVVSAWGLREGALLDELSTCRTSSWPEEQVG